MIVTTIGYGFNYYISSTCCYIFGILGICAVEDLTIIKWDRYFKVILLNLLSFIVVGVLTVILSLIF